LQTLSEPPQDRLLESILLDICCRMMPSLSIHISKPLSRQTRRIRARRNKIRALGSSWMLRTRCFNRRNVERILQNPEHLNSLKRMVLLARKMETKPNGLRYERRKSKKPRARLRQTGILGENLALQGNGQKGLSLYLRSCQNGDCSDKFWRRSSRISHMNRSIQVS
jgi:hypothetical protein